jgi:hypothetical protein
VHCLYCRENIGWLRRQFDRRFCSADHRRKASIRSARALRDAGELEPIGLWLPGNDLESMRKSRSGSRSGASAAVLICTLMLILLLMAPKDGPTATAVINYTLPQTGFGSSLRSTLPGWQAVRLRDDFRAGLGDWVGSAGSALDWSREGSLIRPGKLRLWGPSLKLADYQVEFEGQIERRAMGWTFRSNDLENYYATKLSLTGSGPSPRAEIVRYVVLDGKVYDRIELPLPLRLLDGATQHVKVDVRGSYFVTSINGRVVDSWSDRRLKRGGVGFFADKGEVAAIRWVSLNTAEPGFFSRLFASTLFIPPGL